jgi:hypothetical protein
VLDYIAHRANHLVEAVAAAKNELRRLREARGDLGPRDPLDIDEPVSIQPEGDDASVASDA